MLLDRLDLDSPPVRRFPDPPAARLPQHGGLPVERLDSDPAFHAVGATNGTEIDQIGRGNIAAGTLGADHSSTRQAAALPNSLTRRATVGDICAPTPVQ